MVRFGSTLLLVFLCLTAIARGSDIVRFCVARMLMEVDRSAEVSATSVASVEQWYEAPGLGSFSMEAALSSEDIATEDPPVRKERVVALLSRAPLSPTQWVALAALSAASGGKAEEVGKLLSISSVAGPNEGYVMTQRGILGVSLWDVLPADYRARTYADLVSSFALMSRSEQRDLQQVLSTKSERVRQEIREALGDMKDLPSVSVASARSVFSLDGRSRSVATGWFDLDWMNRRSILVDNSEGTADLSDYQVRITITPESGMREDFADVRFTDRDGTTQLSYWRESAAPNLGVFWVKIPSIPARGVISVFMYYGNPDAEDRSDGERTFLFFDDFSSRERFDKQWTVFDDGGPSTIGVGQSAAETPLFSVKGGVRGIINDHQYFYAIDDRRKDAGSSIVKVIDGKEMGSLRGPPCATGGAFREDSGTLLISTCGGANGPEIWEIDRRSGQRLGAWPISDGRYGAGVFAADKGGGKILVVDYDNGNRIRIREASLVSANDLAWTQHDWHLGLGVRLRGIAYLGQSLFVVGQGSDGCRLFQVGLPGQASAVITGSWALQTGNKPCVGLTSDGEALYVASSDGSIYKVQPELNASLRIQVDGESRAVYVASRAEFSPPVAIGVRTRASGAYPGLLWLGDLTAKTPNEAQNLLGMMPHPNGSPSLIYVRQRELGEAPSSRAYKISGSAAEAQDYQIRWSTDGVSYVQAGAILGAVPSNVPRAKLRIMFGGGTFNQTGFSSTTNYVYVRRSASAEPLISFDETTSNPFPEKSRAGINQKSRPLH